MESEDFGIYGFGICGFGNCGSGNGNGNGERGILLWRAELARGVFGELGLGLGLWAWLGLTLGGGGLRGERERERGLGLNYGSFGLLSQYQGSHLPTYIRYIPHLSFDRMGRRGRWDSEVSLTREIKKS